MGIINIYIYLKKKTFLWNKIVGLLFLQNDYYQSNLQIWLANWHKEVIWKLLKFKNLLIRTTFLHLLTNIIYQYKNHIKCLKNKLNYEIVFLSSIKCYQLIPSEKDSLRNKLNVKYLISYTSFPPIKHFFCFHTCIIIITTN